MLWHLGDYDEVYGEWEWETEECPTSTTEALQANAEQAFEQANEVASAFDSTFDAIYKHYGFGSDSQTSNTTSTVT